MHSARTVYLIIGVMALMPILYFGLRAALKRRKLGPRRVFTGYVAATAAGCVLAVAAIFGLYRYSVNSLPLLVMERAVRDAASGSIAGQAYLAEGAQVETSGFDGQGWSGAMVRMPKKVMQDGEGRQLYPVQVELGDRACILLFRLAEENGEALVPARVESVEYIAPEDVEEKIGGKMTYFDTSRLP